MAKAFFLVRGEDLRGEIVPPDTEPRDLSKYDVLVCSNSLTPEIGRIREMAKPGATLLCYINTRAVSLSGPDNAIMRSHRDAMGIYDGRANNGWWSNSDADTWYFHLGSGKLIADPNYPNLVMLRPVLDAAEALANWCIEIDAGWDGWYLDDNFTALPGRLRDIYEPSDPILAHIRWTHYRDHFNWMMRYRGHKTSVGNVGGTVSAFPRHLHAITIEASHGDAEELVRAMSWAKALSRPDLNIVWGDPAGSQIAEVPGMIVKGTVR